MSDLIPSLAKASPQERSAIFDLTAPERAWYDGWHRFATNADILEAAGNGNLVPVSEDNNIRLIGRLRNPEWQDQFPPFLLKHSEMALRAIGRQWRSKMNEYGSDTGAQLAVTSLARSEEMQDAILRDPTKVASPDSTHVAGASFDIDASAYYLTSSGVADTISVISPKRDRKKVDDINTVLRNRADNGYETRQGSKLFDRRIPSTLLDVVDAMHQQGLINRIVEYAGTGNQCVHICPSPEVEWEKVPEASLS